MNHCIACGRQVACGRTARTVLNGTTYCLICQTARLLNGARYETPAMKRWKARVAAQEKRTKR